MIILVVGTVASGKFNTVLEGIKQSGQAYKHISGQNVDCFELDFKRPVAGPEQEILLSEIHCLSLKERREAVDMARQSDKRVWLFRDVVDGPFSLA